MPDANVAAPAVRSIEVFCAYSHKDETLRNELETHISILKRRGIVSVWHDRRISGGMEWAHKIDDHLNRADIILLLVSADFIDSDYCYNKEMTRAMERHELEEARVIPVILRDCYWDLAPFSKLLAFPKDGKPVATWITRDEAFKDVAIGIRNVAEELRRTSPKPSIARNTPPAALQDLRKDGRPAAASRDEAFKGVSVGTRKVADELLRPLSKSSTEWETVPVPPGKARSLTCRSPKRDPRGLLVHGARIEVEIGPPVVRTSPGPLSPSFSLSGGGRFSKMPALIDIGAGRTVVTPAVVERVGLRQVDVTRLARAGGINEDAGVYVAAIRFPRYKLATIEVANVICCELPEQPIQCLIGRDILSRWLFTYDGRTGEWTINEEDIAAWVDPP
jgi:predicted aspartyl protease